MVHSVVKSEYESNLQMSMREHGDIRLEGNKEFFNKDQAPSRSSLTHFIQKSVSFDQIHIRQYQQDIGDNPSCSSGPPVAINWDYSDMRSIDVAEYEETRPSRRYNKELLIPRSTRIDILTDVGYSPKQIMKVTEDVNKCKHQREKSARSLILKFDTLLEKANKKLKKNK